MKKSDLAAFFRRLRKPPAEAVKKQVTPPVASDRFGGNTVGAEVAGIDEAPAHEELGALTFDIASLLRPRTFLYLFAGTLVFLFQTYNTLAIISLAKQNEKLREQLLMTKSVLTSQELKVHELHSIHNISLDALKIGLMPSGVPPVEIVP